MRSILKPLQWLYTIYALLTFVILMVPVFIWSLAASTLGKVKGGNLIYKGCTVWADVWFALIFIRHKNIFVKEISKDKPYIYVANHISYLDAAAIPKTFRFPIRPLGKIEMTRLPVFGFIYQNAIVSVDRSDSRHRAKSVQQLKSILKKGISILVFPEGTFNQTKDPVKHFYDGAFRIAIETGTPLLPVLLLDTYDRMHYRSIFSLNPGRSRAVFLPEVSVEGFTIADIKALKEKVHNIMHRELLANHASWVTGKRR